MPLETLADDRFWADAFDKRAPFYDSYVKYFRMGVLEMNPAILDVHREAIYYIRDDALAPIVSRLLQIAEAHPDYGFVESLAFFLAHEEQSERLKTAFGNMTPEVLVEIKVAIDSLCSRLLETGDNDLAEQFSNFLSLIS